jgi:DNA-binding GntR family transcriptional regulator
MKRSIDSTSDAPTPIQDETPRTMAEIIYRKLRSDIVWGVLPPGAPLRSDELRAKYGVGISPLREALSRLMVERLVTTIGQRGFRVAPISAEDVLDVTETRLVVERAALAKSIERGDLKWETRIVAAFHALSKIPLPPARGSDLGESWASHHREFHMALLSGCGSPWQINLAGLLFDQADRFRLMPGAQVNISKAGRDPADEHRRIMQATLGRNVEKALQALESHYRATTAQVIKSIGQDNTASQRARSKGATVGRSRTTA